MEKKEIQGKITFYLTLYQLKWKSLQRNCGNHRNCKNEFIWSAEIYIDVKVETLHRNL